MVNNVFHYNRAFRGPTGGWAAGTAFLRWANCAPETPEDRIALEALGIQRERDTLAAYGVAGKVVRVLVTMHVELSAAGLSQQAMNYLRTWLAMRRATGVQEEIKRTLGIDCLALVRNEHI